MAFKSLLRKLNNKAVDPKILEEFLINFLLELFFDKIVAGGILILDDYATMGYEKQYFSEKEFFKNRNYSVVELPTGQGIVIKR